LFTLKVEDIQPLSLSALYNLSLQKLQNEWQKCRFILKVWNIFFPLPNAHTKKYKIATAIAPKKGCSKDMDRPMHHGRKVGAETNCTGV
jgi:hypothetical protein